MTQTKMNRIQIPSIVYILVGLVVLGVAYLFKPSIIEDLKKSSKCRPGYPDERAISREFHQLWQEEVAKSAG
jgi:hypothetical protein